jgi:hypothetical protein
LIIAEGGYVAKLKSKQPGTIPGHTCHRDSPLQGFASKFLYYNSPFSLVEAVFSRFFPVAKFRRRPEILRAIGVAFS